MMLVVAYEFDNGRWRPVERLEPDGWHPWRVPFRAAMPGENEYAAWRGIRRDQWGRWQ